MKKDTKSCFHQFLSSFFLPLSSTQKIFFSNTHQQTSANHFNQQHFFFLFLFPFLLDTDLFSSFWPDIYFMAVTFFLFYKYMYTYRHTYGHFLTWFWSEDREKEMKIYIKKKYWKSIKNWKTVYWRGICEENEENMFVALWISIGNGTNAGTHMGENFIFFKFL